MSRYRILIFVAATLSATLWAYACGDGTTEPPTSPPDPPRPTTVTVTPATTQLTSLGATVQLSAEVRDQNGQVMAGAAVSWTSSAAAVATVSATGLVTAAGNGTATITATAGAVSGSATVSVAQRVSSVTVSPAADTLVQGDTLHLSAEAVDSNGHAVAEAEFEWASSDTLVATVDDSGLVTGMAAGEAEIAATSSGATGRAQVTVVVPVPTTVTVTPDSVVFTAIGQTGQLSAEVRDQIGRPMVDVSVSWSSSDTTVAAVDSAGLVTAAGIGVTAVTVTVGEVSGASFVTVEQSAGSVIVSPRADTLAPADTLRLLAEAYDENGHPVESAQFSWSSSDVSVARVDGSGLVHGVAEGTATITATVDDARGTAEITVENPDRAALVALYEATDGPNWVNNENWLTDAPLDEWYGVGTDGSGRVVRLTLRGTQRRPHGLSGPIPPEVGHLTKLASLSLEYNQLSGPIPPELGNLSNLTNLNLWANDLEGPIPAEIRSLANLGYFDIDGNRLTGPIPPELGSLTSLEYLHATGNELTGPIPRELGSLANLKGLGLGGNNLTGPIPVELANLSNLIRLSIGSNELTGPIPAELANLTNLTLLFLPDNRLEGPIPPELGNLTGLTRVRIDGNRLTGPVPQSFLRLEHLEFFWLADNASLCVPGTSSFVAWSRGIERTDPGRSSSFCNSADVEVLESLHASTGGADWTNSAGWLSDDAVEEWYGVAADSLGHVVTLDLAQNGLAGQLPSNLGLLTRMTELRIGDNNLSGRLPLSLAGLALRQLHYGGTELCTPIGPSFQEWLRGIPSREGPGVQCAPLSDREILETLFAATGGPRWVNSEDWLTEAPLGEWHGVTVDAEGRVVELNLHRSNLTGSLPPELGNLANLTRLDIVGNEVTGQIPPELGNMSNLTVLGLGENSLSGPIPPELGNLTNLRSLNLNFNDLKGRIPAELGNLVNLTSLRAQAMGLTGVIPPELGRLVKLRDLLLGYNELTGPIPPELAHLAELRWLDLWGNELTGSIPVELGRLSMLEKLDLARNELSGTLPPQLGNLANLQRLELSRNHLSGGIPAELGDLVRLTDLNLDRNNLAGTLPSELGNLRGLFRLNLSDNGLSGPVAPEFGGMSSLQELSLTNNSAMSGPLPAGLTALDRLDALLAGGTGLCAPSDAGFQTWLEGVHKRRIAGCVAGDAPTAYLTQATQSREFPVPLVAGERALLRVFPTADQITGQGIPTVRVRFYRDGSETHVQEIPGKSVPIPTAVDESDLSKSANAEIPGHVIQPGLEMVIEVDPDETLDPSLGVAKRIPETGRLAAQVRVMPLFDLTVIPFIWNQTRDASIVDLVGDMAADPENHTMLGDTRTLLPIGELKVTAHEPVSSASNNVWTLLSETMVIRAMEGGTGHYMGTMALPLTGAAGAAETLGRSSFSTLSPHIIAHELGHNLSLDHAPCGLDDPDPAFPYTDGSIGTWGYDFRDGGRLMRPSTPDLMSYCASPWISDYHFANALRFRLVDEGDAAAATVTQAATRSLLLWGGVDSAAVPYLEPAFVVDAPPVLPETAGEHRIIGWTASGGELFSLSFDMPEMVDGAGSSSFAFVLPLRPGWEGSLASIALDGPGGSVTLNGESDVPMAILRNPRNGQVRGILRDLPAPTQAAMDAVGRTGPGLEVLFSRGIPGPEAWRR